MSKQLAHIAKEVRQLAQDAQMLKKPAADSAGQFLLEALTRLETGTIKTGVVYMALPWVNWYRVHVGLPDGVIYATTASNGAMGARPVVGYPPMTAVILFMTPELPYAIIIGAMPVPADNSQGYSDAVQQGSAAGFFSDPANLAMAGDPDLGMPNLGENRQIDGTSLDWGVVTETGVMLNVDPFMLTARVSETCGLWLNYWDSYTRLAGENFDLHTSGLDWSWRSDQSELREALLRNVYPWEAVGLYAPATAFSVKTDPAEILDAQDGRAAVDTSAGGPPRQTIARRQEYGGYLGQGGRRLVMVPTKQTGERLSTETRPDMGVFEETIGLDGFYGMRSAAGITLAKHVLIPVPVAKASPENPAGDAENYRPGGFGEDGPPHVVKPPTPTADTSASYAQGGADLMSYLFNWQSQHPFHYHEKDYHTPQESALSAVGLPRAQDHLDFRGLAGGGNMPDPAGVTVPVDHRQTAAYFQRTAAINLLPDGGITLTDGYGARIVMSGGNITIEAPGDIRFVSGRSIINMAGHDAVVRAHQSVDITAGQHDVTIKAERNARILGGNKTTGGVLIESQSPGYVADFDGVKVGEETAFGGIVLKAAQSAVCTWAGAVYTRVGGEGLSPGSIVLDAPNTQIVLKSNGIVNYVKSNYSTFTTAADGSVASAFIYSQNSCVIGSAFCYVGGSVVANGQGVFNGVVLGSDFGSTGSAFVGQVDSDKLEDYMADTRKAVNSAFESGAEFYRLVFDENIYASGMYGNAQVISQVAFTLRDDAAGAQYGAEGFELLEPYWQTLVRLGGASGGTAWTEPPVRYSTFEQQPFPGKSAWEAPKLLQPQEYMLYDVAGGLAKDRGAVYEQANPLQLEKVSLANLMRI